MTEREHLHAELDLELARLASAEARAGVEEVELRAYGVRLRSLHAAVMVVE